MHGPFARDDTLGAVGLGVSACREHAWPGARLGLCRSTSAVLAPRGMHADPQRLPPRPCLCCDLVPLAADLVLGGPLATVDAVKFVADLAAGGRRGDGDDHDAEERGDHREDRADHAVAGGKRVEEVRHVHGCAHGYAASKTEPSTANRDELMTRDPPRAEDVAAPGKEDRGDGRADERRIKLEAAVSQERVDGTDENEIERKPGDPQQAVRMCRAHSAAGAPRSARTSAARLG